MNRITRLSWANIRRHKTESFSLVLLIMLCMLIFGSAAGSIGSIKRIYPELAEKTDCVDTSIIMSEKDLDPAYQEIILEDENVSGCGIINMLWSFESRWTDKQDTEHNVYTVFVTEAIENQIENTELASSLDDSTIAQIEHPVWLPCSVHDSLGFNEGDTFTFTFGINKYPFEIAGFYDPALFATQTEGLKAIVSDDDYRVLSGVTTRASMLWWDGSSDVKSYDYAENLISTFEEYSQTDVRSKCYRIITPSILADLNSNFVLLLRIMMIMSGVVLISVLVMIRYLIKNDIEEQVVSIGVLEALGYKFGEIMLSYITEYFILAGIGMTAGAAGSFALAPVMFRFGEIMSGHHGTCTISAVSIIAAALILLLFVSLTAFFRSRIVKNYPPVTALRKGIRSHHFAHDSFPLEKTKKSVHLRLAMKGFLGSIRKNTGGAVCIIVSTAAIIISAVIFSFLGNDMGILMNFSGVEIPDIQIMTTSSTDTAAFAEELREMPMVRKVNINSMGFAAVYWKDVRFTPVAYDDYSQTESIHPSQGRFPEHENEIMLPQSTARNKKLGIGDTITLTSEGIAHDYIITGLVTSFEENTVYMLTDGYRLIRPADRPFILEVFVKDGADTNGLISQLSQKYGRSVADIRNDDNEGSSFEERVRAEAERKIAVLMEQYGVDHVDYAIMSGDTLISGDSSSFRIKEIVSVYDTTVTQLASYITAIKITARCFVVISCIIIMIVLSILITAAVRLQRHELGIMKSLGYTSRELMFQLSMRIMPMAAISVVIGTLLSLVCVKLLTGMIGAIPVSLPVILISDIAILLFCFASAFLSARKVKKITVCELMTE